MKAIGVFRERTLAGKPESDERILKLVGMELAGKGFEVELKSAEDVEGSEETDLVFTMARSEETREKIQEIERRGAIVVNSPKSVGDSLNRELSYKRLAEAGADIPKTNVKPIGRISFKDLQGRNILKRADRHEEWFVISDEKELEAAVKFYKNRDAKRIAIQEFVHGEHVKYYVIGRKVILPEGTERFVKEMKRHALIAGKATGLEIYGGDFILAEKPFLVDVNDWPSFGSVKGYTQEEAAKEICRYLAAKAVKLAKHAGRKTVTAED